MDSVLRDKLHKLQGTQETINSTADFLIENSESAKDVVKTWNEEFATATVGKKLILLYLANDVLQRCKTNAFLPDFLRFLPKATAHLYKHGDGSIRSAVMRLVGVWTERKVLRSRGIAAVQSHLEKVKDLPPAAEEETKEEESIQGNKRKRGALNTAVECLEEVEEVTKQRTDGQNAISQLIQEREMSALSKEELIKLSAFNQQQCEVVKSEMQVRKRVVDLMRETLTEHEEGLKESKELWRLCFQRKEEIERALEAAEALAVQESYERRESVSLSEENMESTLLHVEDPSSTMNLQDQNHHGFGAPNMPYGVSPLPPYLTVGHMGYPNHAPGRSLHTVNFPMMHPDGHADKTQDHELPNLYRQNPPFMRQGYMPDGQAPPIASYDACVMHDMHSPYGHQLNYGEYPGQHDTGKDWRT